MKISIPFTNYEIVLGEPMERDQPTVAECIDYELNKPENAIVRASFARHEVERGQISPSFLPAEYDDVKFGNHADAAKGHSACKLVTGRNGGTTWCRTVGEYKAACKKNEWDWFDG